jgi:hypothetical protein
MIAPIANPASDASRILTGAVANVAELWGFSNAKLGAILGVSPATASRLRSGQTQLDPGSKSFEAGQFLVRLFRSLDALLGSDDAAARAWLGVTNLDLEAAPFDMIASFRGLIRVCDYVDYYRARV